VAKSLLLTEVLQLDPAGRKCIRSITEGIDQDSDAGKACIKVWEGVRTRIGQKFENVKNRPTVSRCEQIFMFIINEEGGEGGSQSIDKAAPLRKMNSTRIEEPHE